MMQSVRNFLYQAVNTLFPPAIPTPMQKTAPFGSQEWEMYLHMNVPALPLPENIESILQSPCPFWPDKRIEETHILCLIPQGISAIDVIEQSSRPSSLRRRIPELNAPSEKSYWILITKCVIPSSSYLFQTLDHGLPLNLLPSNYTVPRALEAITAVLTMKFLENIAIYSRTNERTLCQEQLNSGISIAIGSDPYSSICIPLGAFESNGIAAVRCLRETEE